MLFLSDRSSTSKIFKFQSFLIDICSTDCTISNKLSSKAYPGCTKPKIVGEKTKKEIEKKK